MYGKEFRWEFALLIPLVMLASIFDMLRMEYALMKNMNLKIKILICKLKKEVGLTQDALLLILEKKVMMQAI